MHGLMQDRPLALPLLLEGLEGRFSHKRVDSVDLGGERSATYGQVARRIRQVAGVLNSLDVPRHARVGVFGWNSQRLLELYMAVPCANRILHTINHRLFAEDMAYVINDAADDVLFIDRSLLNVVEPTLGRCPSLRHIIVMDDGSSTPLPADHRFQDYEQLLEEAQPVADLEVRDENDAASLCYTSGTTGRPKGVLYSHRSIVLHSMSLQMTDGFAIGTDDTIMPIVPMFHVNAWGLPYAAMMSGANLALPGPVTDPASLIRMMSRLRVTFAAAVCTVWQAAVAFLPGQDLSSVRHLASGGGPLPQKLSAAYLDLMGQPISSSWGMTETSPLVCSARLDASQQELEPSEKVAILADPGRPGVLCSVRIVDEQDHRLSEDGTSRGELQVSGPTIAAAYYGSSDGSAAFTADGWLRTGDIATIDAHGSVRIVDRVKELIKSGGEWISPGELERHLLAVPGVAEASVVGIPDEKWGERPVAFIVEGPGMPVGDDVILEHLASNVAKWWLPKILIRLDNLPTTGAGKISKIGLRDLALATRF